MGFAKGAPQQVELTAHGLREGAPSSTPMREQPVDGLKAAQRIEPLCREVALLEVHVSQFGQRPLRTLGLPRRMDTERGQRLKALTHRKCSQARIAVCLRDRAAYRLMPNPARSVANDQV